MSGRPITVKAKLLTDLDVALNGKINNFGVREGGILNIEPPATPKGRYALAKAGEQVAGAAATYQKQALKLLNDHAKKDGAGKPQVTMTEAGVSARPEDPVALQKALDDIGEEDTTLTGVRAITHAELGACPITGWQERMLIAAGLLEDKEPE